MTVMNTLADLKPDQKNARKHNPRNIGMIANSLREVGVARSGVIDEDGNILAGNGTYEALSEAGIENVKIIQADGNEWVVVQRKGLSEEQKLKLALYDNRSAELAEWDKEVLADIEPSLLEGMFSGDELLNILDMPDLDSDGDESVGVSQKEVTCPKCEYTFVPEK
jgi:ParB-like chromosome segregation protein Spo0J